MVKTKSEEINFNEFVDVVSKYCNLSRDEILNRLSNVEYSSVSMSRIIHFMETLSSKSVSK